MPGPWSLAGDLVAAPRWPLPGGRSGPGRALVAGDLVALVALVAVAWFVITCARLVAWCL